MWLRLSLQDAPDGASPPNPDAIFDERGGVIGRSEECDWRLPCHSKLVSRRHAVVTREGEHFFLYDASVNGVFFNGDNAPLGQGERVQLSSGDTLRMGDFVISAELLDRDPALAPASQAKPFGSGASEPEAEHKPEFKKASVDVDRPVAEPMPAAEPAPPASSKPARADLGGVQDAFRPPDIVIPEDWDFRVDDLGAGAGKRVDHSVRERLNALQPAAYRALLEGLGLSEAQADGELTEAQARAMGRAFRLSLERLLLLREEFDQADQRLPLGPVHRLKPPEKGSPCQSWQDYVDRLLATDDATALDDLTSNLDAHTRGMAGRHLTMVDSLVGALSTVLTQFAPSRVADREAQDLNMLRNGKKRGAWLGRSLRRALARKAQLWRSYSAWFERMQADDFGPLRKLFEKKSAALYAARIRNYRSASDARPAPDDDAD